ncbi:peptidylprolyl isomerase [Telmatospirillum siberiense]|nr:peptidyl-prolyl cis-trans isomerase [Telmatospirillum siberiense]
MRQFALFLAAGLLPVVLSCPAAEAASAVASTNPAEVVARVGGADLTTDDVRAYVETLAPAERAAIAADPARLGQAVRLYLAQRLVLKEALDKKFDQKAATKAQLDRVRDAALSELYLASVVKVPDGYPSDAEVQAAYDANKSAFVVPRQYRLAQIFIGAPKGDKEDKGKLDAVVARLKAKGADFAAIAGETTDTPAEAGKGGELGWVAESQLVPEIKAAVAGLAKDAVSDPIRMEDGWHIIKLQDTKPAGTAPLADIKPALVERLRQAKAQQLRQAYLGQLLQKDPPVLNELALAKITLKK